MSANGSSAAEVPRKTTEEYWNDTYDDHTGPDAPSLEDGALKRRIRSLVGDRFVQYTESYSEHLVWDLIYPKYLPATPGAKVLEVGSAPGTHLVSLHERFGYEPYGVEYAENGVAMNRSVFRRHGLDPANVIHADFFGDEFRSTYGGFFDIVVSRGFVEHFDDVDSVVQRHVDLLRPGGHLVIEIPNLKGVNYLLTRFFHREVIDMHNLDIMEESVFSELFQHKGLLEHFCDYYGAFTFGLLNVAPDSRKIIALKACLRLQQLLNVGFRTVLRDRSLENPKWSPHLLYIGTRAPDAAQSADQS